jgi:DMSO reductase anchor subunit
MHPAFSVIFFTTASGAGFGLWAWFGLLAMTGTLPPRVASLLMLGVGAVLAGAGLFASLAHLGQPQRAWRAFSQWRSSWLSREGIVAVASFAPAAWMAWLVWTIPSPGPLDGSAGTVHHGLFQLAGGLLVLLSLACVVCTAMIYASLKPIPAWRHPLVVPTYLVFSLFTGFLLFCALLGLSGTPLGNMVGLGALVGATLAWRLKRQAWQWIDTGRMGVTRNAALGLPEGRTVRVFERPHTEANYLLMEMGYVLARKHAARLRSLAVLLFALVPALLALPVWLFVHLDPAPWMTAAAVSALIGTAVERWLFFAEAKHLVTLYY